jgi:hypothetical protein
MSNKCALDGEIRATLKLNLRQTDRTAAIIEELPLLRGRGRADIAFVNGKFSGYEIKSEADSLVRLGTQTEHYQSVFEFITLVVAKKHLKHARKRIPAHWGIIEVIESHGQVLLHERRKARANRYLDKMALSRMLWKRECIRALSKLNIPARSQTPVRDLWKLLESLPSKKLCDEVRIALKLRHRPTDSPQIQCDDSRTTATTE